MNILSDLTVFFEVMKDTSSEIVDSRKYFENVMSVYLQHIIFRWVHACDLL